MLDERKENENMLEENGETEKLLMSKANVQDFSKQEIIIEIIHAFRDIMIEFFHSS